MPHSTVDVTIDGQDKTKPAFDSAEKNAESFGGKLKETLNKPFELLKGLIAVELVRVVGEFFKGSVEAAAESEAAWSRVAQSVENAGIRFDGVKGQLVDTFEKVSEGTRFTETQVADAFGTLLNVTNDYSGSVKNLSLVTNIAVARHMELDQAATLVGRVMDGNTSMLKRYGIVLKDGGDAMQQLREKFDGFSERDSKTLEGRLKMVSKEWEELKIKLGEAITSGDGFTKSGNAMVDALKGLGDWIGTHQTDIAHFVEQIGKLAEHLLAISQLNLLSGKGMIKGIGLLFGIGAGDGSPKQGAVQWEQHGDGIDPIAYQQIKDADARAAADRAQREGDAKDKALTKEIDGLKQQAELLLQGHQLGTLTVKDYEALGELQYKLQQMAKDTNLPLRERVVIQSELNKITDADHKAAEQRLRDEEKLLEIYHKTGGIGALGSVAQTGSGASRQIRSQTPITMRAGATPLTPGAGGPSSDPLSFGNEFRHGAMTAADSLKDVESSIDSVGRTLGTLSGGALKDFFGEWQQGIQDVIAGHEAMGVVIPRVLRRAVGASLAADAQDTFLRAAKALALGLTDPSGIHLGQAAKLFAIGTAEVAAAAALSGGGGGGGGYGGGVSAAGFQQTQNQIGGQGKVTVIFPGKKAIIDTNNPDDLNALRDALQSLVGTRDLEFLFQSAS